MDSRKFGKFLMYTRKKKSISALLISLSSLLLFSACSDETKGITVNTTESVGTAEGSIQTSDSLSGTEADEDNDNADYYNYSYIVQLYRQDGSSKVTYDDHIASYECCSEKHVLSFSNMGDYALKMTMFVVLNGELISFSVNDGEAVSYYNFSPPEHAETQIPFTFKIDESMLKYNMNQCDIITVMNIPINRFGEFWRQNYFYNSVRLYFENSSSDKSMAPVYDTEYVMERSEALNEFTNDSAVAIITSENEINGNTYSNVSKTDGSFYFLFGRDSKPESEPAGGANYAYFLMDMESGPAELDELSGGIVYLEKGEVFQKEFHVNSEKTKDRALYGIVIPL
ncbi:MAG: hypothetical protein HDT44_08000, partial [Ruminococcaceae bacterium]|nr:hypothetical protein [Oscillospiraceae bacterium]